MLRAGSVASAFATSPFRDDALKGRVVLVTGGATGIGFACCEAFGRHGAKVAIAARRLDVVSAAVEQLRSEGIEAFGVRVDVRDYDLCTQAVKAVGKHYGRLDFLINNAAGNFMASAEALSPNGLATVLGIDLQGCFHMAKACLPVMKRTSLVDGAVIVNITATLQDTATPFQIHAASAKAGIDVMTNTLGVEWGEYNIRTVGLAPGGIAGTVGGPGGRVFGNDENKTSATGAVGSVTNIAPDDPDKIRNMGTAAGRWGRVEDIALAAVYMCSSAATWITATRLVIDGGGSHDRARGFVKMKRVVDAKSSAQKTQFGRKAESTNGKPASKL